MDSFWEVYGEDAFVYGVLPLIALIGPFGLWKLGRAGMGYSRRRFLIAAAPRFVPVTEITAGIGEFPAWDAARFIHELEEFEQCRR
jgi:hypothetical protein